MKQFATGIIVALVAASAFATDTEVAQFAGAYEVNYLTGETTPIAGSIETTGPVTAYDNLNAPAAVSYAVSSTDLTATWGDEMTLAATGVLDEITLTIFNSTNGGANTSPIDGGTLSIGLARAADGTDIGGFNGSFTSSLQPGFFSTLTFSNLSGLGITIDTTDVVLLQSLTALTGGSNRAGIAVFNPVVVGASPDSMFVNAATIGGGAPGFYTFTNGPANPGYTLIVPEPASLALLSLAALAVIRRR